MGKTRRDQGFKHKRRKYGNHFTALEFQGSVCKHREKKKNPFVPALKQTTHKMTNGKSHRACLGSHPPRPMACTWCQGDLQRGEWLVELHSIRCMCVIRLSLPIATSFQNEYGCWYPHGSQVNTRGTFLTSPGRAICLLSEAKCNCISLHNSCSPGEF